MFADAIRVPRAQTKPSFLKFVCIKRLRMQSVYHVRRKSCLYGDAIDAIRVPRAQITFRHYLFQFLRGRDAIRVPRAQIISITAV